MWFLSQRFSIGKSPGLVWLLGLITSALVTPSTEVNDGFDACVFNSGLEQAELVDTQLRNFYILIGPDNNETVRLLNVHDSSNVFAEKLELGGPIEQSVATVDNPFSGESRLFEGWGNSQIFDCFGVSSIEIQ